MNKTFLLLPSIIILLIVIYIYLKPPLIHCKCSESCKYEYKITYGSNANVDKAVAALEDSIKIYAGQGWEVMGTAGGGARSVGTNIESMYGINWNEDFVTVLLRRCKTEKE